MRIMRKTYRAVFLLFMVKTLLLPVVFGRIPALHIPTDVEIFSALKMSSTELRKTVDLFKRGKVDSAKIVLTGYYKATSAVRYYFNWENFEDRFRDYQTIYPEARKEHYNLAKYQMKHYGAETRWQLPFQDLTGEDVTAYQLRHLARQQKSADIALVYYYEHEDMQYLDYFQHQVNDLNRAFDAREYDDAGNGIYESFRAGKRIHNWLFAHHAYLASEAYDWQSQYLLIKTFLHHAAQLQKRTAKYSVGNHHTKGLVALYEIGALFPEFKDSDAWRKQAVNGLMEHMNREINADGFQFERSVHYHKGDIENYFRVYQLAEINGIDLPEAYMVKFRKLFDALVLLARPDRRLPVLQDDTGPMADFNDMDDALTVGAILFRESCHKYFAAESVVPGLYWLFRKEQLKRLGEIQPEPPEFGSTYLPQTGYYIMRNGWDENDCHMVITAGLSERKPDHQHADMLGLVAYANGHAILPNYQVKYNYPDFIDFKNSWVKNVALVDSIPQANRWKPNTGGSGFGEWLDLPHPEVMAWTSNDAFDYFSGRHDGYEKIGVQYSREVLFIKDGYWVVRDRFESAESHTYQQLWQGDYRVSDDQHIYSEFDNGSGLAIVQLPKVDYGIDQGQNRDKQNLLFSVKGQRNFSYTTLLMPFDSISGLGFNDNWPAISRGDNRPVILNGVKIWANWIIKDTTENYYALALNELSSRKTKIVFKKSSSAVIQKQGRGCKIIYLGNFENEVVIFGKPVFDTSNIHISDKVKKLLPGSVFYIEK